MFPNRVIKAVARLVEQCRDVALDWQVSGAGGGGCLILVSDAPIDGAVRVIARCESDWRQVHTRGRT